MAKVKKEDIKELSTEEVVQRVKDEEQRYRKLKFNHAVSPLENPLELKFLRKDIARLKTELRKRELESEKENK